MLPFLRVARRALAAPRQCDRLALGREAALIASEGVGVQRLQGPCHPRWDHHVPEPSSACGVPNRGRDVGAISVGRQNEETRVGPRSQDLRQKARDPAHGGRRRPCRRFPQEQDAVGQAEKQAPPKSEWHRCRAHHQDGGERPLHVWVRADHNDLGHGAALQALRRWPPQAPGASQEASRLVRHMPGSHRGPQAQACLVQIEVDDAASWGSAPLQHAAPTPHRDGLATHFGAPARPEAGSLLESPVNNEF
jgi:hypothetical protein